MTSTPVNDNHALNEAPASFYHLEGLAQRLQTADRKLVEGVVTAAVLTTVSFRLRDEEGLVVGLRRLADAIDAFDRAAADAA